MTDYLQISEGTGILDYGFINLQSADIPAYSAVIVDASNALSISNITDGIAVKLPAASSGQTIIGVTMETLKASGTAGRVRVVGPIGKVVASAAITAGAIVMGDATGNGTVITQTSGLAQLGIALSSAVNSGDEILLLFCAAFNH